MSNPTIAFIGAGQMATALAKGFVAGGLVKAGSIIASDASPDSLMKFAAEVAGSSSAADNTAAAKAADVVILAVKPQYLTEVLTELRPAIGSETLVVSIAAGIQLTELESHLAAPARVIRVMPNTPSLVGRGASGYSLGKHATPEDSALVGELLRTVGVAYQVPEPQLNGVTGLSSSGPAFVYTVIEAMADAGVRTGLPRAMAADLAAQTVAGAAQMVIQTGQHPAQLRDAVTSPGGTTAAGLAELESQGVRHALASAINAAVEKSKQMGENASGK